MQPYFYFGSGTKTNYLRVIPEIGLRGGGGYERLEGGSGHYLMSQHLSRGRLEHVLVLLVNTIITHMLAFSNMGLYQYYHRQTNALKLNTVDH